MRTWPKSTLAAHEKAETVQESELPPFFLLLNTELFPKYNAGAAG